LSMDKPKNFDVRIPERCPSCGSRRMIANVRPAANALSITCEDCKFQSKALAHISSRNTSAFYHWALSVKQRDDYKCRICGSRKDVNAHHIIAVKNDKEHQFTLKIENGITLCGRCHGMAHGEI